jgi:hypothetical protein
MAEASLAIAADDVPQASETAGIAEDEHDLAVLDMVAAEMGALDLSEPDVIEPQLAEPQYVEPEVTQVEAVAVQPAEPEALNPDLMTLAQIAEVALAPEPPQPDLVPSGGSCRAVAWRSADRWRRDRGSERAGIGPAGADPQDDAGREDRVLLVSASAQALMILA